SQAARAGEQRAEDAQPGDEPRDEHGAPSVAMEESIKLLEPRPRQPDVRSVPFDEPAPVVMADEESEVVAEDGPSHRRHDHPVELEPAEMRQRGAGEQGGLAGNRQPGVLEEDAKKHHRIPIARKEIDQPLRHLRSRVSESGIKNPSKPARILNSSFLITIARPAERPSRPFTGDGTVGDDPAAVDEDVLDTDRIAVRVLERRDVANRSRV